MAIQTRTIVPYGNRTRSAFLGYYGFSSGTWGENFYVNSNASASGSGYTPEDPVTTLAAAIALCTANNDDTIHIAPGHSETLSSAAAIASSKAGVHYKGYGQGNRRPLFTWAATDATWTVAGANSTFENIRTTVSTDEVVSMFAVSAAGVTFDRVDFVDPGATQALQWLLTTNAADQLTIKNCRHIQTSAANTAQKWIELVGTNDTRILDNTFLMTAKADTGSHLISGSTAVVNVEIMRNYMYFLGATISIVVNLVTTSTGFICDNRLASGTGVATAAAITGDACFMANNLWADTAAASGLLAPAVDTDT